MNMRMDKVGERCWCKFPVAPHFPNPGPVGIGEMGGKDRDIGCLEISYELL